MDVGRHGAGEVALSSTAGLSASRKRKRERARERERKRESGRASTWAWLGFLKPQSPSEVLSITITI